MLMAVSIFIISFDEFDLVTNFTWLFTIRISSMFPVGIGICMMLNSRGEDKKWHHLSFGRTNEPGISHKLPKGIQEVVHCSSRPYSLSGCDSLYIRKRAYRSRFRLIACRSWSQRRRHLEDFVWVMTILIFRKLPNMHISYRSIRKKPLQPSTLQKVRFLFSDRSVHSHIQPQFVL